LFNVIVVGTPLLSLIKAWVYNTYLALELSPFTLIEPVTNLPKPNSVIFWLFKFKITPLYTVVISNKLLVSTTFLLTEVVLNVLLFPTQAPNLVFVTTGSVLLTPTNILLKASLLL